MLSLARSYFCLSTTFCSIYFSLLEGLCTLSCKRLYSSAKRSFLEGGPFLVDQHVARNFLHGVITACAMIISHHQLCLANAYCSHIHVRMAYAQT